MNSGISTVFLFTLLLSCKVNTENRNDAAPLIEDTQLIEAEKLMTILDDRNLKIIDFRRPEQYESGHIPKAINIWRTDLTNTEYPYGGMMLKKDDLNELLSQLGISNKDYLVIYDDNGSVDAARLRWVLRYYYFDAVKILNGGLTAWKETGGSLSQEHVISERSSFFLPDSTRKSILIEKDELNTRLVSGSGLKLIDVRSSEEYSGMIQKAGGYKAGRIPGSIHIEWSEAIDLGAQKKFRSTKYLIDLFEGHGIYRNDTVVVYCHSGSRSAHTTFVLEELLDFKQVMNYDGSWTEWSYYDHLPIETDSLINATH